MSGLAVHHCISSHVSTFRPHDFSNAIV